MNARYRVDFWTLVLVAAFGVVVLLLFWPLSSPLPGAMKRSATRNGTVLARTPPSAIQSFAKRHSPCA